MGSPSDRPPAGRDRSSLGDQIGRELPAFLNLVTTYYRGEVDRTTAWRTRLDQTTNWAVVVVAAILTWAFSSADNPHYVVLIGVFGVTAFLVMEANRYREYDIWRTRMRTMQEDLIAEALDPGESVDPDWRSRLAEDIRNPTFGLSFPEAIAHRLRRSYLALLLILLAAWLARVLLLESTEPWQTTASILGVPGPVVALAVGSFYAVLIGIAAWSARGTRVQEFRK